MARYGSAALAYDMQATPAYTPQQPERHNEAPAFEGPRFDVYTGSARDTNQLVSPVFVSVVKTFCILAAIFVVVGLGRVTLASATAAVLNSNASMQTQAETSQAECKELEVMRAVYGSETRIRDLAEGYGMTTPESTITLDFSSDAQALRDQTAAATEADEAQNILSNYF